MAEEKPPSGELVPASTKLVSRKRAAMAKSRQSMDKLWQVLETRLGGREGFLAAALSSSNPKAKMLVEMILDVKYRNWGTKKLALRVGLTTPEIVDMFRDRQWLEATLALHEELPDIIRDAAQDARASMISCPDCRGLRVDAEGRPCVPCKASGEIRRPGDKDKLAFVGEAVGMIRNKGPLVQVNNQINNNNQPGQPTTFDDLMRKATVVQARPALSEVKEAEIVESSGTGSAEPD